MILCCSVSKYIIAYIFDVDAKKNTRRAEKSFKNTSKFIFNLIFNSSVANHCNSVYKNDGYSIYVFKMELALVQGSSFTLRLPLP